MVLILFMGMMDEEKIKNIPLYDFIPYAILMIFPFMFLFYGFYDEPIFFTFLIVFFVIVGILLPLSLSFNILPMRIHISEESIKIDYRKMHISIKWMSIDSMYKGFVSDTSGLILKDGNVIILGGLSKKILNIIELKMLEKGIKVIKGKKARESNYYFKRTKSAKTQWEHIQKRKNLDFDLINTDKKIDEIRKINFPIVYPILVFILMLSSFFILFFIFEGNETIFVIL